MTEYKSYIPIVCIGDCGEWEDIKDLIKQQQKIIDTCENKDKFIIIGLFSAPVDIDPEMSEKRGFGCTEKGKRSFLIKQWLNSGEIIM